MANILLGVSGSISAYKAAEIVSRLKKLNHNVNVCLSEGGKKFIKATTLQTLAKSKVYTSEFEDDDPLVVRHIELAKQADLILIAPASANMIAKLANGIANDMLTCAVLAGYEKPLIIAPAMNTKMYENPIVVANIDKLKTVLAAIEIEPKEALLACEDYGKGALAEIDDIITKVEEVLSETSN